jgi:GntR family transcriptional regulator / MocR family aminotransferase
VARNTVALAYGWLAADGLRYARGGAGTAVGWAGPARPRWLAPRRTAPIRQRAFWEGLEDPPPSLAPPRYDFDVGAPDPELFPWEGCLRAALRHGSSS